MEYIRITKENIDKEDICCAMSANKSAAKKEWMKKRFDEGLTFIKAVQRGKCFIEYVPAENAWVPIDAEGYLFINCLWVAGSMKGNGYSNDLMNLCIEDAKSQGRKGICILSSTGKKKEFLSDPKYLKYKGFLVADESDCGINLMYLPLKDNPGKPQFKECAKHPEIDEKGIVLYYTDQCPFTDYWVPRVVSEVNEKGILVKTVHITDKEAAQNIHAPVSMYALFKDGVFLTQGIQSTDKFLKLIEKTPVEK